MEQNFTRVWERQSVLRFGGVLVLQEVADLFYFLGSSANKDARIAQTLFVSIFILFFLAFWQCQMKKDLKEKVKT